MSRIIVTTARKTLALADELGATIAPDVRDRLARELALSESADRLDVTGPSLADATRAALAAGRDPLTDQAVAAAVTRQALAQLASSGALAEIARQAVAALVAEHRDDLVAAFQPAYTEAADQLATEHAIITGAGIDDLDDPTLINAGMTVTSAYARARQADHTLRRIGDAVAALLVATGRMEGTPVGVVARLVDAPGATADDLIRLGKNPTPWQILSAGYRPSIATPSEAAERYARAYAAQRGVAARTEQAERDAMVKRYGSPTLGATL